MSDASSTEETKHMTLLLNIQCYIMHVAGKHAGLGTRNAKSRVYGGTAQLNLPELVLIQR